MSSDVERKICDLKLNEIRTELKKRNIKCVGKKTELISKLKSQLNSSYLSDNVINPHRHSKPEKGIKQSCPRDNHRRTTPGNLVNLRKKNKLYFGLLEQIKDLRRQLNFLSVQNTKLRRSHQNSKKSSKINNVAMSNIASNKEDHNHINTPAPKKENRRIPEGRGPTVRNKILMLGDNLIGNMSLTLSEKLKNKFDVTAIIKPNANFKEVTSDIFNLTNNFTHEDFVIIEGGLTDALNGRNIDRDLLHNLTKITSKTNLIFMTVPYWNGRRVLNNFIQEINTALFKSYLENLHITGFTLLNVNDIISSRDFTYNNSLQLKFSGKLKVVDTLRMLIIDRRVLKPWSQNYVTHGNLTYIMPLLDCDGPTDSVNSVYQTDTESVPPTLLEPKTLFMEQTSTGLQSGMQQAPDHLDKQDESVTGLFTDDQSSSQGESFLDIVGTIDLTT